MVEAAGVSGATGGVAAELITLALHLAGVIERENEALQARRRDRLPALIKEKEDASRVYAEKVKLFSDAGTPLTADPGLRVGLRQAAERLDHAAVENERLLRVARQAQRRVMDAFVEAVRGLPAGPPVYGRDGGPARSRRSAPASAAVSFDRKL